MTEEPRREQESEAGTRWSALPPRTRLADTTAMQETPPKPEIYTQTLDANHEFTIRHG